MRIAYIIGTLASQGGTSKIITDKINLLSRFHEYDIFVITCEQYPNQRNTTAISNSIKQINLAIPFFHQYRHNYPLRLWYKWYFNRLLKKRLTKTLQEIEPDILIGITQYKADIISQANCRAKKIFECHEARPFILSDVKQSSSLLIRSISTIYRFIYFKIIERHADVIVTLTEKDKLLWTNAKRVEVIPNFSTMAVTGLCDNSSKRIIAVGRIEWEKGYERLLEIWKIVSKKYPNWHLDIFGTGSLEGKIKSSITDNQIINVSIHNYTQNISQEYAKSSICVVTSYAEGFSLVLLEAMRHGVCCIAFDCPFGPGSIIRDGQDGYLIPDGDITLFAEKLSKLIKDVELRKQFSKSSIERSKFFDVNVIMDQWGRLFESIIRQ